jgi:hypothetical protein
MEAAMQSIIDRLWTLENEELLMLREAISPEIVRRGERKEEYSNLARSRAGQRGESHRAGLVVKAPPTQRNA